jgi:hypothetical protein
MRMLRQVAPLTLAIPPPSYVKFLPKVASSWLNVLAVSPNGYIQTLSLNGAYEPLMDTLQIQYATMGNPPADPMLSNQTDEVTVVNTSSNGHFIAVGSQAGVVSLHASVIPRDPAPIFQFNKVFQIISLLYSFNRIPIP